MYHVLIYWECSQPLAEVEKEKKLKIEIENKSCLVLRKKKNNEILKMNSQSEELCATNFYWEHQVDFNDELILVKTYKENICPYATATEYFVSIFSLKSNFLHRSNTSDYNIKHVITRNGKITSQMK